MVVENNSLLSPKAKAERGKLYERLHSEHTER